MRKFTTLILSLLMLAVAFPFVGWAQQEEEPVIYFDSNGYILDSPDHVRLDVPVIDRMVRADDTCNKPEVRFTGLAEEVFPNTANTFVARVYSHGLQEDLNGVYYDTYYRESENASEITVSSVSTYGSIKFNIRLQGDDNQDVSITNGSGLVSFTYNLSLGFISIPYTVKAMSLGIVENYCIARNRPLTFTYNLNRYGVYRMHYKIVHCTNSKSGLPTNGYTPTQHTECCGTSAISDYYSSSCTWSNPSNVLYETDMYMRVVSTKILAHPQGGEICSGQSKTLTVNAETCLSNGITYQWYKWNDGVPETINGATTNTYVATEAGEYYCVTNDGREPRETEHAVITVIPMPEVTLAADQYICPNGTLDLVMPAGAAYRWSDNSTNATLHVTTPNTYSVTMTSNGCSAAYSFNVQQLSDVNLITNASETLCPGTTLTETLAVDNATDIVWNNNASLNQSSLPISEAGTYTVSANVNGCPFADAVEVVAPQYGELINDETVQICEGGSYQVNLNANELSNIAWSGAASGNEATKTFTLPGIYNVSAQYQGCTFNDSFTLSYKQMPEVDVPANHILCANSTVSLTMPECDSYQWNDGSTVQTLPVTAPGNYSVTMTYNGCDFSRSFSVEAAPIYNIIADDAVTFCYGTNETLELAVNNASEIVWNNNAENNESTYVIAEGGTYTVSAKIGECTYTDQIVATQTENVNLIADETLNFCYGTTETLELAVANATDIVWNNDAANNGQTFVINQSGAYPVSAKVDGCTYTDQITAIQSENVNLIADETVNFCYGTTETLALAVNNATDIVWNNDAANNGQTFVINQSGTYPVSAKVDGCTYTDQITATQSENVNLIADETVNFCYGTTETLALAVNNATEIVWNNDAANNGQTFVINQSGTYPVSAKVDGCTYTDQIVATQSGNVNLIADETVDFCYGTAQTLALAVNNATDIVWNNDAANNGQTFVINQSGTYLVSAKVDGCTYTDQIVANQSENVNLLQFDNIQFCYGSSQTLELTVNNASNIVWNNDPSLNETTLEVSELGTYTVEADVDGCHYTDEIVAIETQNYNLIPEESVVICYGSTAMLNLPATAINAVWNNNHELNQNTLEISEAGTYTVSADYNGCRYNDQVVATIAPELTVAVNAGTINCNGGTTTVEAVANGGVAPYAYAWNNNVTTQSIDVAAGSYNLTVTDGNGCIVTATTTIEEPAALSAEINAEAINCHGGTTTAIANVSGGTEPYAYAWNNNAATQSIEAAAGEYNVVVTDAHSCTFAATLNITEPAALAAEINAEAINCHGGTTTAMANVSGGTEPYAYAWNNNAATQSIEAAAGEYNVVVTDAHSCTIAATVNITEPAALSAEINAGAINCNGGTTTAIANVSGGTEPYAFAWNNNAAIQSIEATAGEYNVVVTDAHSCTIVATANIEEPAALSAEINAGTINCHGGTTTAIANVSGGTEPYAFAWNNNAATQSIEATAGEYNVVVTDAHSCTIAATVNITEPAALSAEINAGTINCHGGTATTIANVSGGTEPYAFAWNNNAATQSIEATAGAYNVVVTDAHSCTIAATVTIEEPAVLAVAINAGTIGCNGTTATAEAVVEGGVAPYAFAWSNQATTQNIADIVPGTYSVTVTDVNGCSAMTNAVVTEPAVLSVSINAGTINCHGETAAVEANVSGGTTPYAYSWSNNAATQSIDATAGEYNVVVTDANGCTAMASTAIEEPAALIVSIIAGTISCNGGTTMAVAHANGGVAPYSYAWNNQGTAQNISNIVAGNYSVTVVDNNECSAMATTTVTEPESVNLIADETVNFCEGSTVTVLLVEGATNVVWNNSEVGANNEIGIAGTYTVSADVNGCNYTDQVVAVERPLPESGLNHEYSYVILSADTTIVISANADYDMYSWSNGSTGNSLTIYCDTLILPFDADYNLTITTEYGCSVVDTVSVHVEMSPSSVSEFVVNEWNVVPNPNDGNFEIVGAEFDKAELYDSNGRFVALIEGKDVSLSDIKPGMYYLRIYSEAGVSIQKVLINK